jgi:hypothetical protein
MSRSVQINDQRSVADRDHKAPSTSVRPAPDIMSLLGSAHTSQPRDPNEKSKARLGRVKSDAKG